MGGEYVIREGDEVKVFPSDDESTFYRGIVRWTPAGPGDCWVIDSTGVIVYQQTFNRIVLVKRSGER